jgi:hypothetical protein
MESMSTKIIRRNHYVPETVQERKTQAEHLKLLTIKSQRDIELLEEAREYFKKRAQIEAEYSKNLRSLASTHLSKPLLEDLIAESRNKITVASSFKRILDETVNLADRHNDMSLSFSNQLVEAFKNKIILKKNLIKRVTLNICLRILLELLVLDYSGPFETTRTLLHSTATTRKA